jgi:midasin (ATPase involved in ribosome maturation)
MSQQSDVADLLGGFMPVGEQFVYSNLCREFMALFARIFSKKVFLTFICILCVTAVNDSICFLMHRKTKQFRCYLKKFYVTRIGKSYLEEFDKEFRRHNNI